MTPVGWMTPYDRDWRVESVDLFDPDGAFVGTVPTDFGFDPLWLWAAGDRIYAAHHGERGEPYLIRARVEGRRSGPSPLPHRRP